MAASVHVSLILVRANALKSISTSERSHVGRNWQHELDFDLGEVAPYVTCDLSEVEMNVESDILPMLDLSEVPKNFDAFALILVGINSCRLPISDTECYLIPERKKYPL